MANHDYDLADQNGAAFLNDINSCLKAIRTNNSGGSDPPGSGSNFQFQWYADTGDNTLKIRNANGDGFVNVSTVGGIELENLGLATAASPTFTGTASFGGNVKMTGTGTLDLPAGTTGQRPASPNTGMIRFNTSNNAYEGYSGSEWKHLDGDQTPAGTIIYTTMLDFTQTPPVPKAPPGYLPADGSPVSRTTFAALFAAIQDYYGVGDGSTTFNLPDLRGEFIRGLDSGRGVDSNRALGSAQGDQNKTHNHGVENDSHSHSLPTISRVANATSSSGSGDGESQNYPDAQSTGPASTGITIQADGGTEARPRNIALLACIKT